MVYLSPDSSSFLVLWVFLCTQEHNVPLYYRQPYCKPDLSVCLDFFEFSKVVGILELYIREETYVISKPTHKMQG
jgi:hypothetical protein